MFRFDPVAVCDRIGSPNPITSRDRISAVLDNAITLITDRENSNVRRFVLRCHGANFIVRFNADVETYSRNHRKISRFKMWSHIATSSKPLGRPERLWSQFATLNLM
jgi:hypothetical protein